MILQAKAGFHVLQASRKKQGLCSTFEIGSTLDEVAKETQLKEGWVERGSAYYRCSHKSKGEQRRSWPSLDSTSVERCIWTLLLSGPPNEDLPGGRCVF